jgi:Uma2 family endonuclease
MATQPSLFYTFEQYLELEEKAQSKSEYRDGVIVSMPGGTELHSRLSAQMIFLLKTHLKNCNVYDGNLLVYAEHFNECMYPDAMAVCGKTQFWEARKNVITNPTVVVEVLSASTRKYDETAKSGYYRSLPSVMHLVLVSQDEPMVQWSTRHENTWITTKRIDLSELTPLGFILADIYAGILPDVP